MVGALLILLTIVNSFLCGWLVAQVRGIKRTIGNLGGVVKDMHEDLRWVGSEVVTDEC